MIREKTGRALRRFLLLTLLLCVLAPVPAARAEGEKLIAFTFDDGPSNNTPVLLDGLEARGAVATFFMCGMNGSHGVVNHRDLVERMNRLGCQMANHSYGHPNFTKLSGAQMRGQLEAVEEVLYDVAGAPYLELVRIPGGSNSETIRANVAHPIIRWSCDPFDWRDRNADTVYRRIMELAFDGGVILLHDLYPTSIEGGLRAMDSLKEQGYTFVTVSELFRRRGIYLENGVVYDGAPNKGITKPPYVAPTISAGTDDTGRTVVTMTTPDLGIDAIHYTTDGSTPTLTSPVYTGPIPVTGTVEFHAIGFDRFATRTPEVSLTASNTTAPPRIASVNDGKLTLSTDTPGAKIFYTTDGTDPRLYGSEYQGEFTPGKVTKAVAVLTGRARSDVVTITQSASGTFFTDLDPEAWYADYVADVVGRGLMGGLGNYRFAPDEATTRAAIVSVLYRLEGSPGADAASPFLDVKADAWYAGAVSWAYENGIITGKEPDRFDPDGTLTRQQCAAVLYRYAEWAGRRGRDGGSIAGFPDSGEAENYAIPALEWCEGNGLLQGLTDGRLAPKAPATRAQCAAMLSALCAIEKK